MHTFTLVRTILAISVVMSVTNLFIWQSPMIGMVAGGAWLTGTAILAGMQWRAQNAYERVWLGLLTVIVLVTVAGSTFFYLARITDIQIAFIIIFLPAVLLWITRRRNTEQPNNREIKPMDKNVALVRGAHMIALALTILYVALYVLAIASILNHQTVQAIRSPWEVLPRALRFIYFLLTLIIFFLFSSPPHISNRGGGENKFSKRGLFESPDVTTGDEFHSEKISFTERIAPSALMLLSLHFFLTFSLALLVYRVGYGFDPFVHRATESILASTGTITPKPFLYVGQYALVVFFSKLFVIPISLIDTWLLPLLASFFLPSVTWYSIKNTFPDKPPHILPTTLALLILPASFAIATIPQSFANLIFLFLVLLSFPFLAGKQFPLSLLWGLGVSAFFIHPLTGIPALMYCALCSVYTHPRSVFRRISIFLILLTDALAIPVLVAVGNMLHGTAPDTSAPALPFPDLLPRYLPFLSLAHTAELWHRALPALFVIAASAGTALLWKQKRRTLTIVPWLTVISLGISYLLVRNVPLPAIIAYEREEFTERILELMGITLLPFFTYFLLTLFQRGLAVGEPSVTRTSMVPPIASGDRAGEAERPAALAAGTRVLQSDKSSDQRVPQQEIRPARHLILLTALSCLITVSFYYSYPRVDSFAKSRGFSVSQSDIEAVRWIEHDAGNKPYLVLANQSVSAAALQEFGFKRYFNSTDCKLQTANCKLFYYPIPTSSPLYQYFLDMVYTEASRETMLRAMQLAGVHRAYFVLNDYWLDAEKIATQASRDADGVTHIGATMVFRYRNE